MVGKSPLPKSVAYMTGEQEVVGSIPGLANVYAKIDDGHSDRVYSSLTTDLVKFNNNYFGKHQVAWKEHCACNR